MPLFNLKCECGEVIEDKYCSYDSAKTTVCPQCGAIMEISPVKNGGFKIYGFSSDNNFECDHINYDGTKPDW